MTDELAVARVHKEQDNTKVRPIDLLRTLVADIESGKLEADGMVVLTMLRPEGRNWEFSSFRCGVTRCEEIARLVAAQERAVSSWHNGG